MDELEFSFSVNGKNLDDKNVNDKNVDDENVDGKHVNGTNHDFSESMDLSGVVDLDISVGGF